MLRIYEAHKNQFRVAADINALVLTEDSAWLDLVNPSVEEEKALEAKLGFELPTREEMRDIEPSSRLYEENGVAYMTATLVWKADTMEPESANVAFVLSPKHLITIRYAEPRPLAAFVHYAERQGNSCDNAATTLVALLEAIVDRLAEILENKAAILDSLNRVIFPPVTDKKRRTSDELQEILRQIARTQDMTSKARDSLVSLGRMVSFLMVTSNIKSHPQYTSHAKSIVRDIQSLTDHTSYLSSSITFMMDAAMGLINIEQNAIIKIFSVASVVFLPPTLVASIYGMNFHMMPELSWEFGYPLAILLMIASAVLPYMWFKKKGWL